MIASFVLKLVSGIVLMWLLMPRKEVTDGFFRIQMLVVLGLCVLLVLTIRPDGTVPEGGVASDGSHSELWFDAGSSVIRIAVMIAAGLAFAGHIVWKLGRRVPGAIAIYGVSALCLGSLIDASLARGWTLDSAHSLLSSVSAAAVLGATLTGMLLGHWYLTTPTMSIGPLSWFPWALAAAAGGRMLATCISLERFGFESHDMVHWLWFLVRILGGILVPLTVAIVVVRILKFRNTQSATGVLFAALILVFMGEMSAALLERDLRVPY